MPEVLFRVRWPDGQAETCWSPSTVIRDFVVAGRAYPLADFLRLMRGALAAASERVRMRHGSGCPRAMAQLAAIERRAQPLAADASVVVEAFIG